MQSWLVKQLVERMMAGLRAGDPSLILRLDAEDVVLRFPGDNSWGGEIRGRDAHEAWLRRFIDVGVQIYPDEVVAKGFPWRITMCVRGRTELHGAAGEKVYENRYVLWGTVRWGRLKVYEVYEDTEETARLEKHLAEAPAPA
jgi:ketosteroid isomerase-like protein